jgi:hypothetical protein
MPSTIPYDPALALGNLVSLTRLDIIEQIAQVQAPADAAEDTLNALISTKRSLDMTGQELMGMGIDISDVISASEDTGKDIATAAAAYAKAKIAAVKAVGPLRAKMSAVNESIESPIDYNRSQIKQMPLSADSLNMNVQYFANDTNSQNSSTHAQQIASFVTGETATLGKSFSLQASTNAASQVNSQVQNHSIAGTLVIAVTCTHKDAVLLAPFILDVDKGIRAFNAVFPDNMIKTDSVDSISTIAAQSNTKEEKALTLLSGATMGSSFVGMVHVLNETDTAASESMESVASSLQTKLRIGSWFKNASGGFGVSDSFSDDAKALLSTQNVTSHCSLTTIGSIPSIKSNQVQMAVQQFTDFDGKSAMSSLLALQGATDSDQKTVASSAQAAITGGQFTAMRASTMQAALSALSPIDDGQNKMIDTNSMMDALDDYIQKCLSGNIGAPITYYLKRVTASQLAQMWMAKYYPGKYLSISGDDSGTGGSSTASSSTSGGADAASSANASSGG